MSESLLGNTVYLTNDEYSTLIANGSVTLASGTTINYSENDTYIVPEILDTTPTSGSTNAVTSDGVYKSIASETSTLTSVINTVKTTLQGNIDSIEKELSEEIENHTINTNNPHKVTKAQVGLGSVDNTSDLSKPISTATQTALDKKADNSNLEAEITRAKNFEKELTTKNTDLQNQIDSFTDSENPTIVEKAYWAKTAQYDDNNNEITTTYAKLSKNNTFDGNITFNGDITFGEDSSIDYTSVHDATFKTFVVTDNATFETDCTTNFGGDISLDGSIINTDTLNLYGSKGITLNAGTSSNKTEAIKIDNNGNVILSNTSIAKLNAQTIDVNNLIDGEETTDLITSYRYAYKNLEEMFKILVLQEDLKTYYDIGKIEASPSNPVVIGKEGDTILDVIHNICDLTVIQPTIAANPSITATITWGGSKEDGTSVVNLAYNITTNVGYYICDGIVQSSDASFTSYTISNDNQSWTVTNKSGSLVLDSPYNMTSATQTFNFNIKANYSAGSVAKDNTGSNSNPIVQIPAGSCSYDTTLSLIPTVYYYYNTSTSTTSPTSGTQVSQYDLVNVGKSITVNSNNYLWIFTTTNGTKTIQNYSDIAKAWATTAGGTVNVGAITFTRRNGTTATMYAYRTVNVFESTTTAKIRII